VTAAQHGSAMSMKLGINGALLSEKRAVSDVDPGMRENGRNYRGTREPRTAAP